jgi:hypothetical protein
VYINDDEGFSIVYEEEALVNMSESVRLDLNNIAVSVYNRTGNIINSFLIPKSNWIDGVYSSSADFSFSNQYKRFTYINGNGKSYILLNDTERNIERIVKDREPIKTIGISQCDAFYFPLTGNNLIPNRVFLFGKPEDNKEHNLAVSGISAYDRGKNIFVTLQTMPSGRDKTTRLVWFTP